MRKTSIMYSPRICKTDRCLTETCKDGVNPDGRQRYATYCTNCKKARQKSGNNFYRTFKGKVCEECGFVPQHPCQLDVDHIDGNHRNNDPTNLQTLCANCHRLKSITSGDNCQR